MKGRFPSDLLLVVFGPILVAVIALVVGSLIFHAAQWGRVPMIVAIVAICFAYLLFLFLSFSRRSRRRSLSMKAQNEATPTI